MLLLLVLRSLKTNSIFKMSQKLEVISYELERRFRRNNLILKHSRKISDTANLPGDLCQKIGFSVS